METTETNNEPADKSKLVIAANDNNFSPRFTPVRWLELNSGATRVKRSKERSKPDELWHGDAFDPQRPDDPAIAVYLRLGGAGALIAELVCGCMARALGLPAPEVFIVSVRPGVLRRSGLANKSADTLCVATRDVGGDTFAQLLNDDDDAALRLLCDWANLNKVAAFDEWTANPDRNMGNLIYAAQTLYIIDHADALGGQNQAADGLKELTTQMFSNRLADLLNVFDVTKRSAMLKEIEQWVTARAAPLDLPIIVANAGTFPWRDASHDKELVDFLTQRLTVTHSLLCHRLGHPQLDLKAQISH